MTDSTTPTTGLTTSRGAGSAPVEGARAKGTVPLLRTPPCIHGPAPSGRAGRRINHLAALAVAAAVALSVPSVSRAEGFPAGSETAAAGAVSATLHWDLGEFGPSHAVLEITRGSTLAFAREIPDVVCTGFCQIVGTDDLSVTDLDSDGEGEVVVAASTGGEHCCFVMGVYDFRPATGTYGELVRDWGSTGFELRDLDHDARPEIVASDVRFDDLFTGSHAASFPPPAVFSYERPDGLPTLADVTTRYPALVARNAAEAKSVFRRFHRGDVNAGGFVAAYVADQYLLENGRAGLRELDRQIRRGILGTPRQAKAYRKRLLWLLHRFGYR
jgi:hypothetical protein